MSPFAAEGANADQIRYWNERAGLKWARDQNLLDRVLEPVSAHLLAAARPRAGERVLDIGCGCGSLSVTLAERVGPAGQVLGIDISEPMLARARAAAAPGGPEYLLADATSYAFTPGTFDLACSRFGVMFFAEPERAFANIRKALKPSGRLAFACWQALAENPWVTVPLSAALQHVPQPEPSDPNAPGPYAFADAARVHAILGAAGFTQITIEPVRVTLPLGAPGPRALEEAVYFVQEIGPVSRLLDDAPDPVRGEAISAVREALAPLVTARGIELEGAIWCVGARA